ncbi:unnamed protein product [Paramecium octaurelia]|uniref:Uncharacterized protein n=1 Tax=Paramecium octaurelia TaxID=43137 RepID=A0A8S1TLL8_PAROT|nr:unnamed protein product [Paramecium octaurelia]
MQYRTVLGIMSTVLCLLIYDEWFYVQYYVKIRKIEESSQKPKYNSVLIMNKEDLYNLKFIQELQFNQDSKIFLDGQGGHK